MKAEKGITLTSLVIYMIVSTIVIGILAIVTTNFVSNTKQIKDNQNYAPEFNQFAMFFIRDCKNNKTIQEEQSNYNQLIFEDNTTYVYDSENKNILRNGIIICRQMDDFSFTLDKSVVVNHTQKHIVIVKFKSGSMNQMERGIRFVLKYW